MHASLAHTHALALGYDRGNVMVKQNSMSIRNALIILIALRGSAQQSVRLIRPFPVSEVYYVTLAFMLLLIRMLIGNSFIRVHVTCFVNLTLASEFGYSVTPVVDFWVFHQQSPHLNVSQLRFRAPCGNPVTGLVYCFETLDS